MRVPSQLGSPAVSPQACQHWRIRETPVHKPWHASQQNTIRHSQSAVCAGGLQHKAPQSQKWRASGFFQGLFGGGGQSAGREADPTYPVLPSEELPFPLDMLCDTPLRSACRLSLFSCSASLSAPKPSAVVQRVSWREPTEPQRTAGARWTSTVGT